MISWPGNTKDIPSGDWLLWPFPITKYNDIIFIISITYLFICVFETGTEIGLPPRDHSGHEIIGQRSQSGS